MLSFIGFGLLAIGLVVILAGLVDGENRKAGVGVGAVALLLGLCLVSVKIVPAGHRGVLLRLGAVQGVLDEGAHVVFPLVQKVSLIEVRTQKVGVQAGAASRDLQTVHTTVAVNYHLSPAKVGELYKNVGPFYEERVIQPAVLETVKSVVSQYTAANLIVNRSAVKNKLDGLVAKRLAYYDIDVEPNGVSLTDFQFSDEFNKAIEAKQVAQQDSEKQKYVLSAARLTAQTEITKARGEAESNRIKARALDSKGGQKVLQREWINKWNGEVPQVVTGNGGGVFLNLDAVKAAEKPAQ